jgi:hypothetical protein
MSENIRVFISYSHDSDAHRDFVLGIADRLRAEGLDCRLDRYINGFPPQGWQRWMEREVEQADYVLIVCTENYLRRYRGEETDGGRGVNFEGLVISQTLYDHYYRNTKFIPVIPANGSLDTVPVPLKGFNTYSLPDDYEALYRYLTDQHATPAPEVGERVRLEQQGRDAAEPQARTGKQSSQSRARSHTPRRPMSDTMKAAWIGAGAAVLAALVAGFFALSGGGDNTTSGDCSGIFTGDIAGKVEIDCSKEEAK